MVEVLCQLTRDLIRTVAFGKLQQLRAHLVPFLPEADRVV